tara:strand:- start:876 stop:1829 length:954 start_codon:yes stop_codon:yes gene_type:complete
MAFATIAAVAGGGKILAGLAGARNSAQGMLDAGRDSLLTARYNINQRKLEDQQTQFALLEQGHQTASTIQRSTDQAVGSATAAAGGSGAVVDGGTPRAVLTNIAQEGLHAQMGAILNTKNAIKAQARQTEANNKTEWNQANSYAKGLKRDAKTTIDNARLKAVADGIETAVGVYSAGTAGGTKAFSWGIQGAKVASDFKGMSDAQRSHKSVNVNRMASGKNAYNKSLSGGQANNIRNVSSSGPNVFRKSAKNYNINYPTIQGSNTASTRRGGPGSMGNPLGGGKMAVKGWKWNKYTTQGSMTRKGQGFSWRKKAGKY